MLKTTTRSRRTTLTGLTLAAVAAIPLAGAAVLATSGSASAMPPYGWCFDDETKKKVACDPF